MRRAALSDSPQLMNTTTTRRQFLGTALAAGSALPFAMPASAQTTPPKWTRRNLDDPEAPLESYKKAITAMLQLPPENPLNWYRNAFIHILDCPHGNWWFLPWHRGYLGWFERTCRKLSGDADFALPYWDWTKQPKVPKGFDDGVLSPTNALFLQSQADFEKAFKDPVSNLWKSFTPAQLKQMTIRYADESALWADIAETFSAPHARNLAAGAALPSGNFVTEALVSLALKPTVFQNIQGNLGFGSDPATHHSDHIGESQLESGPHDHVHGALGGFMGQFLSPVDPIFFMHHGNLDRLWDVWTRKQQVNNAPVFPTKDADKWLNEPFLFYVDDNGKALSETAKDSSVIGKFDYSYTKGFGEKLIKKKTQTSLMIGLHAATMNKPFGKLMTTANIMLSEKTVQAVTDAPPPSDTAPPADLVARVTFAPGAVQRGALFQLQAGNKDQPGVMLAEEDAAVIGSIRPFGGDHGGAMSFTIPIGDGLKKLQEQGKLSSEKALDIRVVGTKDGKPIDVKVESIVVTSI